MCESIHIFPAPLDSISFPPLFFLNQRLVSLSLLLSVFSTLPYLHSQEVVKEVSEAAMGPRVARAADVIEMVAKQVKGGILRTPLVHKPIQLRAGRFPVKQNKMKKWRR